MIVAVLEGIRPTLMPEGPDLERKTIGQGTEVKWYGLVKPEDFASALGPVEAAIVRPGTPFPKEMVCAMKKARVIVSLGVGFDHIDIDAARKRGIPVCNVPDYGTEEVADSTIAMILSHQRKLFLFKHCCNKENANWDWKSHIPIARTNRLHVGIIGLGRIGTAVAMRLKGFGYKISFFDPYLPRGVEKAIGINRSHDRESLVRSSDIITLHTPLTQETEGMIDDDFFGLLKQNAILINTSRGGIFKDANSIYANLRKRPGIRLGCDVWPEEPPNSDPLFEAWKSSESWLKDRLIICPHVAFYSEESVKEMRTFAAEIVKVVVKGGKPYNVVNGVI